MRAIMRIKIGALSYKVVRVKKLPDGERGEIDFSTKTIKILAGMDADAEAETLLHEVTHGISVSMGEQAVHTFSTRFFQVLTENPQFTKRLYKPLR